jgi:translin
VDRFTDRLEAIGERARFFFSAKDQAREKALELCREATRLSTNAIRAVHRQEYSEAKDALSRARALLKELSRTLAEHPDLFHSGYVHDASKEFAEACVTLAVVQRKRLPSPEDLAVSYAAYLNGMGEAVGELRRYLLDTIRKGDLSRCEGVLATMDDVYGILVTMDFPEALTQGLRRTTDAVRGILEKTRGDLTVAFEQQGLQKQLEALEEKLRALPGTPRKKG